MIRVGSQRHRKKKSVTTVNVLCALSCLCGVTYIPQHFLASYARGQSNGQDHFSTRGSKTIFSNVSHVI